MRQENQDRAPRAPVARSTGWAVLIAWAGFVFAASGCGGGASTSSSDEPAEAQGLRSLGTIYRSASASLKHPPKSIAEIRPAENEVPGGFSGIGETNVAIYFGAEMPADGSPVEGASDTILAYDRMAPAQGGYVLMLDGSVKRLSAEEFKAAKKAGKTPWMAPPGS